MLLSIIASCGPMALQLALKLLPLLYQLKIIKTEAQLREEERRYKEAIKQAEKSSKDPVNAREQYERAKKAAQDQWDKTFGGEK